MTYNVFGGTLNPTLLLLTVVDAVSIPHVQTISIHPSKVTSLSSSVKHKIVNF